METDSAAVGPSSNAEAENDTLTEVQRKLDDIGIMFYTYVGILQRDAPPSARAPDEADEIKNDSLARAEIAEKVPDYARDIITTHQELNLLIDKLVVPTPEIEKSDLERANAESLAAAVDLDAASKEAATLLADIRHVVALRDADDGKNNS